MYRKEGIGSYFHWQSTQELDLNRLELNLNYHLFYTGRQALLYVLDFINKKNTISKIWFPGYYCQHTLHWIKKNYSNIHLYPVNPFEFSQDLIPLSTFTRSGDVVIINNFWGLSSMQVDLNVPGVTVIEDHSHGWLSETCLQSKADYCIVSLRKSLPIPLGGLLWSPQLKNDPAFPDLIEDPEFSEAWNLMDDGMKIKSNFVKSPDKSGSYLNKFYDAEEFLNSYSGYNKVEKDHAEIIRKFLNFDIKSPKSKNLNYLYSKIRSNSMFKIVKHEQATAFGLLLLFRFEKTQMAMRQYLIEKRIYPSILWPDNHLDQDWKYVLNIHADFRYTLEDMVYVAENINNWLNAFSNEK